MCGADPFTASLVQSPGGRAAVAANTAGAGAAQQRRARQKARRAGQRALEAELLQERRTRAAELERKRLLRERERRRREATAGLLISGQGGTMVGGAPGPLGGPGLIGG